MTPLEASMDAMKARAISGKPFRLIELYTCGDLAYKLAGGNVVGREGPSYRPANRLIQKLRKGGAIVQHGERGVWIATVPA